MRITDLKLNNYRNYSQANINLDKGVNIFRGANASGKTNLLEAISLFVLGGSFRAHDSSLVRHNQKAAHVTVEAKRADRYKLKVSLGTTKKGFQKIWKKNDLESNYSYLNEELLGVLFLPTDTELVSGTPTVRRKFFNGVLSQIDRDYHKNLQRYKKTLRQRTYALKRVRRKYAPESELSTWDKTLVKYALPLIEARATLVKKINRYLSEVYSVIVKRPTELEIKYISSPAKILLAENPAQRLEEHLAASRENDLMRVRTHFGPHRDDWQFNLNGKSLSETGSRGEQRSAILALKIAEARVIEEVSQERPVLLLDDVLSELDCKRRETLIEIVKDYQSIITTTDTDFLKNHAEMLKDVNIFEVKAGAVESLDPQTVKMLHST